MSRDRGEVLVGTGTLYWAPENEAFPDVDTAPAGNWADIGYSDDGWAFGGDFSFEDVEVAEEVDPLETYKTAQTLRLAGVLAQASLTNHALAMGDDPSTTIAADAGPPAINRYTPSSTATYTPLALLLRVTGTDDLARQYEIKKAVNVGGFEIPYRAAPNKAIIAVEFRLLLPDSGAIYEVVQQTS